MKIDDDRLCGAEKAFCRCVMAANHDGDHRCPCGGSWDQDGWPVTFPQWYVGPIQPRAMKDSR